MSFINFITESGKGNKVSELKMLEILNDECRSSHENVKKNPIYKIINGSPDFMFLDPKKNSDKSAFWIDNITSELPSWKKFPLRSECIRAFTSYEKYGDQKNSYVVIPVNGSKLGISSGTSFYRSFKSAQESLLCDKLDNAGLSEWVEDIGKSVSKLSGVDVDLNEMLTYKSVKLGLSKIDRVLNTSRLKIQSALKEDDLDLEDDSIKRIKKVMERYVTTLDMYLQEKLDPENNGFHSIVVESLKDYNDREIWLSQPCLLIRREAYVDLHKRGEIK